MAAWSPFDSTGTPFEKSRMVFLLVSNPLIFLIPVSTCHQSFRLEEPPDVMHTHL